MEAPMPLGLLIGESQAGLYEAPHTYNGQHRTLRSEEHGNDHRV